MIGYRKAKRGEVACAECESSRPGARPGSRLRCLRRVRGRCLSDAVGKGMTCDGARSREEAKSLRLTASAIQRRCGLNYSQARRVLDLVEEREPAVRAEALREARRMLLAAGDPHFTAEHDICKMLDDKIALAAAGEGDI